MLREEHIRQAPLAAVRRLARYVGIDKWATARRLTLMDLLIDMGIVVGYYRRGMY